MITFDDFLMEEGVPIYLQILSYVKRGAVAGSIADGDELPSRRVLSARLGVNPNTVQKAYHMLEEEGLIRSHSGAKSCMCLSEQTTHRLRQELLEEQARAAAGRLRQMGLTKEEALELIGRYWQ